MIYAPLDSLSFLLHALGFVATIVVSVAVARWVVGQSRDAATRAMVAILLVHAAMATLYLLQLVIPVAVVDKALVLTAYGLILANPVLWFLFAVLYTGHEYWLTARVKALLVASAIVPFAMSVTNPFHRLLVTDWVLLTEPFRVRNVVFSDLNGPFFLFVSLYMLAGFAVLFKLSLFSRRSSRWQSVSLLVGMIVVQVSALLSVTEYVPITNFFYGIYGAGVFGIIVAISLFRSRLFAVAPLARDVLFDSLNDAILVVDPDRRLVDYNERALDLFPVIHGRIGQPIDGFCPQLLESSDRSPDVDEGRPGYVDWYQSVTDSTDVETGDDVETPFVARVERTIDGAVCSFKVTVSAIERGGTVRGYGLVLGDVTDMVAYSTELERKTERLEQFASILGHDLRNPVTVAMGRVELERDDEDSENLRTAVRALERIEVTIEDLLTLARSGDTITDAEPLDIRTMVEDAWETSDTGSATLTISFDGEYRIHADPSRLRTLLENLFRNAVDHGGDHVTVGSIEAEFGGPTGFFVADDGPGIPEDDRDTVFEYGYTTADGGTGFGLAIVRSVAEAHDWSVTVSESTAGGARFDVTGIESAV